MHDADKNIELSKYRLSLAAETYRNAKMCLIINFTGTALIVLTMRCFMGFVLFLR